MKLHSDVLTLADLRRCLPEGVIFDSVESIRRPRKRSQGWTVSLQGIAPRHTRRKNSGQWGAGQSDMFAASWDDHGVWMAALYEIDPAASIAWYDDREDFYRKTHKEIGWRSRSKRGRRHPSPWWSLDDKGTTVLDGGDRVRAKQVIR